MALSQITPLSVAETAIPGLLQITPRQVTDERGTVREFFRRSGFDTAGLPCGPWGQINVTETRRGTIVGLHAEQTDKLVGVVAGIGFGSWVDARQDSSSYGAVVTRLLEPGAQVFVPAGVCNGFQSLADATQYLYCFSTEWSPRMPGLALHPLDPDLGIDWPLPIDRADPAQLSEKDGMAPGLGADQPSLTPIPVVFHSDIGESIHAHAPPDGASGMWQAAAGNKWCSGDCAWDSVGPRWLFGSKSGRQKMHIDCLDGGLALWDGIAMARRKDRSVRARCGGQWR